MSDLDAVVVGANIRGLVAAHVLAGLGYRAVVVDRAQNVGGADGSFTTAQGNVFDHGLHVLDEMRSEVATRLFLHALEGAVRRVTLRRGIVLRGSLMPYAPSSDEVSEQVRRLLQPGDLVDALGDGLPTRARIGECYGPAFADLVFDEVLPSYPSEARHLRFGVDEARLLTNIYPWFFPRARRSIDNPDESRAFHDRLREGIPQTILYPAEGGFGAFAEALAERARRQGIEVITAANDLRVSVGDGHVIEYVEAGGRRFEAPRYLWAAAWPSLCDALSVSCQDAATDRVMLGSFRFRRPPQTAFHEILVGDPSMWINRVSFPSAFRGTDDGLAQVEFAVPVADPAWDVDGDAWRARWLDDLCRLGVLTPAHEVEDFDFRSFVMHFNGFGAEGVELRDADPALLAPTSNVHPVVPSMANLNLNRYMPRVVRDVTKILAGDAG